MSKVAEQKQMEFDFRRVIIVPNHWNKAYHLQYEDRYSFEVLDEEDFDPFSDEWENHPDRCPAFFHTIQEALDWAAKHGVTAEVPESTITRWS
jgi:hypothetical protein